VIVAKLINAPSMVVAGITVHGRLTVFTLGATHRRDQGVNLGGAFIVKRAGSEIVPMVP
jgi:hypothetical protein